ncbi:hypothetical protein JZ751_011720 [Albula glossodonta]|uniref:Uncharacterized protein n=1 Tax=Albula glossodonta TaxID=121402 RepID=A0A8T2PQF7_9TELE|nr:hypothetical protein JZ751_011720 [Albula glossodonta]
MKLYVYSRLSGSSPVLKMFKLSDSHIVDDTKEKFVWINSASSHAQSVAKAKYEFLFGKAERVGPADTENSHSLPQEGSRTSLETSPQCGATDSGGEDDFDEASLFLEIDRELAHLLRGLGGGQDQDAPGSEGPQDLETAQTMIPCNGQSGGAQTDTADVGTPKPEKSGEPLLTTGLDLEPWAEALMQDMISLPSAEPAVGVNGHAQNTHASQEKPTEIQALGALEGEVKRRTGAAAADAMVFGEDATVPLDQTLEESCKILAEIPGIFTAFLDGGQAKEKPQKKIRFAESRPESIREEVKVGLDAPGTDARADGNGEVGQVAEGTQGVKTDGSPESTKAPESPQKSTGSGFSPLPQPGPVEDEVFRLVPEVCIESPDSESTPDQNSSR